MSEPKSQPQPVKHNSLAMIQTLTLIAVISGFLVVLVYQLTMPAILENQRIATEKAIFQVIPGASYWKPFVLTESGIHRQADTEANGITIYAGYNPKGELLGIAANAAAQGYADTIKILFGYNPNCECIIGMKVLKSAETPGLGDKIFKDADFVENFSQLDARLNAARDALENPIIAVKHGKKRESWQIDSISGATVSSVAVGKALNDASQFLLPKIEPHLAQLKEQSSE